MGNCNNCCTETQKVEEFVQCKELHPILGQSQEKDQHAPSPNLAKLAKTMNKESPEVTKVLKYSPDFNQRLLDGQDPTLPVLGPYKYPDGATYIGQYRDGLRSGRGKEITKDGSVYEGFWELDLRNGFGRLIHQDGDIYEGDWVGDKATGKGRYTHTDGTVYEGNWVGDQLDGFGKQIWADGSVYEGEFWEGLKHGFGKFNWNDRSSYEGYLKMDYLEGEGIEKLGQGLRIFFCLC